MELLDRLAALITPPRRHRHRYFGVLAPNSPQREAVTALAAVEVETVAVTPKGSDGETRVCQAARYAWALLLARIYEVFPLQCPKCGGEMRIIAFIIEAQVVREILPHLGEPTFPPRMAPRARAAILIVTGTDQATVPAANRVVLLEFDD